MTRKKKKFRIIFILEIILILLLLPVVYLFIQIDKIPSANLELSDIEKNKLTDTNQKEYKTIVVFGVDSRANDLKKNTRSDSIMVVSIHKKTKKIKLASIYRDTYTYLDNKHGYTKINHAYSYGGPELALSAINTNFDLDAEDFVTVNFSALTNVIDILGGITLDIQKDEMKYVNDYARDVAKINGSSYKKITKPGKQTVDGTVATGYCRVRYTSGGDFRRAERQRIVVEQIFAKAKKSSIPTLLKVVNEILPQIYTSLSTSEILYYGKDVFFYKIAGQTGFPFKKEAATVSGVSYVFPMSLASNVTQLHEYLYGTKNYKPSQTVQDRNQHIKKVYK